MRGSPASPATTISPGTFCRSARGARPMVERLLGIILPVFLVIALGFAYARKAKPDMAWVNRLNMNVLAPALIFTALAGKDFDLAANGLLILASIGVVLGLGPARVALRAAPARGPAHVRAADDVQQLRQHGAAARRARFRAAGLLGDGCALHDLESLALHARRLDHRPSREVRQPAAQPDGDRDARRLSRSQRFIRRCRTG